MMLLNDERQDEGQHMSIVPVVHVQVADEKFIIAGMGLANRGEAVAWCQSPK